MGRRINNLLKRIGIFHNFSSLFSETGEVTLLICLHDLSLSVKRGNSIGRECKDSAQFLPIVTGE